MLRRRPAALQPLQTVALQRPFVAVLASQLCRLLQDGAWPAYPAVSNAELLKLELDASEAHTRWAALVLEQLRPQADADEPRRLPGVARVLSGLGTRGVSTLLGQRHTAGSVATALPPSREELQDAADALHRPDVRGSKLTVGGRALAKHIHRGSDSHWARAGAAAVSSGQPQPSGTLRGGDGVKSEMASGALRQVILPPASEVSNEGPRSRVLGLLPAVSWPWVSAWGSLECLVETVKTRKKRGKTGKKWARYGLKTGGKRAS